MGRCFDVSFFFTKGNGKGFKMIVPYFNLFQPLQAGLLTNSNSGLVQALSSQSGKFCGHDKNVSRSPPSDIITISCLCLGRLGMSMSLVIFSSDKLCRVPASYFSHQNRITRLPTTKWQNIFDQNRYNIFLSRFVMTFLK